MSISAKSLCQWEESAKGIFVCSVCKYTLIVPEGESPIRKMCSSRVSSNLSSRSWHRNNKLSTGGSVPVPVKPSTEPVGTALQRRIEGLVTVQTSDDCQCARLAADMDQWGIAGCEKNRKLIVDRLVENRDILIKSLRESGRWFTGTLAAVSPDSVLRLGADWLLTQAIEDVRKQKSEQATASVSIPAGSDDTEIHIDGDPHG